MINYTEIKDTFEMPEHLKDFPKEVRIVLDRNNDDAIEINEHGQQYFHWSILNNYVNKEEIRKELIEIKQEICILYNIQDDDEVTDRLMLSVLKLLEKLKND